MSTYLVSDHSQVSIQLHARYPTDYPDSPPLLQLQEAHRLSEDLVKQLLEEINQLAKERVGEVRDREKRRADRV